MISISHVYASDLIAERIASSPKGSVFVTADFLDVASPAASNRTLLRLEERGMIRRVLFGVYVLPEQDAAGGFCTPNPALVAAGLARKLGWKIVPCGETALYVTGLAAQPPRKWVYLCDGTYREYAFGEWEIKFKHTRDRSLMRMAPSTGKIIQTLRTIGQEAVTPEIIAQLRTCLTDAECATMLHDTRLTVSWLRAVILQISEASAQ